MPAKKENVETSKQCPDRIRSKKIRGRSEGGRKNERKRKRRKG